MARYAREDDPEAEDVAQDQDSAAETVQDDTAHLRQALQGKTPEEDLQEKLDAPLDNEASEDGAAPVAPLRRAAVLEEPSPLRVAARAKAEGISSIDADNPLGDRANRETPQTAPKVETPKTPFAKLRQDKRMAEERKARSASIQLTARAGADFRGIVEEFVAEEEAVSKEFFVVLQERRDGPGYDSWRACQDRQNEETWRQLDAFRAVCVPPREQEYKDYSLRSNSQGVYEWLRSKGCTGDFKIYRYYGDRHYPNASLKEYGMWHIDQERAIRDRVDAQIPCSSPPKPIYVQYGAELHVIATKDRADGFEGQIESWAKAQIGEAAEVAVASRREKLSYSEASVQEPLPDLSGAPLELYENSALKEARDMLEEQP